jgi:hypothetical protein
MMPTAGTAQHGASMKRIRAARVGIGASVPAPQPSRQGWRQPYRGVGGIGRPAWAAATAA